MNTTQLENEFLRYTKELSKEALRKVIDFVQLLRQKWLNSSSNNLFQDLSIMSSEQMIHLEEEFKDYKKLYPSE